jgi:hypothetical protein
MACLSELILLDNGNIMGDIPQMGQIKQIHASKARESASISGEGKSGSAE